MPDNTYVFQLDDHIRDVIREELNKAIEADGIYLESEIDENVQRGMESKISDLTDTINVYAIIEKFSK